MKKITFLTLLFFVSVMIVSCCDCPKGDPQNIITQEEAIKMSNLYNEKQFQYINNGLEEEYENSNPDNQGALFSNIDDLQKYLMAVKKEAKAQDKGTPVVKVVFGAKPDENDVPRSHPFLMALVPDTDDPDPDFPWDGEYKVLSFPYSYYDKLDPMGKDPEVPDEGKD